VTVNREVELLELTNQICLADGSVLKKAERFSEQGVERHFLIDGQEKAKIIPRLNAWHDANNWLSMRPSAQYYDVDRDKTKFGEFNDDNELHGRCIRISKYGGIDIGYFANGRVSTGNYIHILRYGGFRVGEYYM
jgi:hypothetical protein